MATDHSHSPPLLGLHLFIAGERSVDAVRRFVEVIAGALFVGQICAVG
jgi:hypothetical protein